jgi:GTPase SAR1 family protein
MVNFVFVVFILGTAGSGKSLLASAFSDWLKMAKQKVAILNLDPGVVTLPYVPDVDIRDYVNIAGLMEEHRLGPNGALIMAADLAAEKVETLGTRIEELGADIVLVDTPGQMELYAFRASGPYIARELCKEPKALVYLFDAVFSLDPLNYVSNLFLSAAVYNRFLTPQIHVLSKSDLIQPKRVSNIVDWSRNPDALEAAIDAKLKGATRLLSRDMMQAIYRLELNFLLVPVSSKTNDGFASFNMMLERVFTGGEKITF